MKSRFLLPCVLLSLGWLAGCDSGPKSGRGLVLPAGSAERGRAAFVELKCCQCHRVDGVENLPAPVVAAEKIVVLGGKVTRLRTYGELVTSIIHPPPGPAEIRGEPVGKEARNLAMKPVNDTMTVTQLVDLVTFLHPRYTRLEPVAHGYQ